MNPTTPPLASAPGKRRRRVWPWVVGLFLSPFVVLGLAAFSFLTLDSDAAALRRHVMRATDSQWHTRIQVSVGRLTLGTVRAALGFVRDNDHINDARLALRAVNCASVGVYSLTSGAGSWSGEILLAETDRAMQGRGWSRLVGITGRDEIVLVYAEDNRSGSGPIELCLAVVQARELVVVSTSVDAAALGDLVDRHLPDELRKTIHGARTAVHRATSAILVSTRSETSTRLVCSRLPAHVRDRTIRFGLM